MKFLLAILFCGLAFLAEALEPLRADFFTQGCGGDGHGSYYSPVVADDGAVAAIAPHPGDAYDLSTPQRCAYLIGADGTTVTQMTAPGPEFFGQVFYHAVEALAADAARENFWGTARFFTGGTNINPTVVHYAQSEGEEHSRDTGIAFSGELLLRLLPNADGTLALLHAVDGSEAPLEDTGLYALDQATLTLRQNIALPHDLGFAPAYTADGSAIFYVGEDPEATTSETTVLALYRHEVASGATTRLEAIGTRVSLKVWDGGYDKNVPMVAVSADGAVVAYRWANGSTSADGGVQLRVAVRNAVTGGFDFDFASRRSGVAQTLIADAAVGVAGNALDCQYPALSADGRFVAFTAKTTADDARQAWRYDRQEQRLECLSEEVAGDCHAVALSPSGRHAAFVAPDPATQQLPQLYRVDGGPAVTLANSRLLLRPGTTSELGMAVAANATATIAVSGEFAGSVVTADGETVSPNTPYSVETLPWRLVADNAAGQGTLTITVTEGSRTSSAELSIIVSNFTNLTTSVLLQSSYYSYIYGDIHFSSDGQIAVFVTDAPLLAADTDAHTQDVYRLRLGTGALELLTGGSEFGRNVYSSQVSGDGLTAYWIDQSNSLWSSSGEQLADGVDLSPAVSHDGQVLAIRQGGRLLRSADAGASWEAVEVPTEGACASPMLSYDGGVLAFVVEDALYVLDGAGETRLLSNGISALEGLTQDGAQALVRQSDGSFAWIAVANGRATAISALPINARELALAANGRLVAYTAPASADATQTGVYLLNLATGTTAEVTEWADGSSSAPVISASGRWMLFASDATNLIGGLPDDNGERDLFLYANPAWSNALPGTTLTQHSLQEDPPEPLRLRLGLRDSDGDALVPTLDTTATLGSASLMPPCEGQFEYLLSYLPPKDFVGTDVVRVRAWDGTGWGAWNDLKLKVTNVNDLPVWDGDTPTALSVPAGGSLEATLLATDVDTANPVPDVLRFSLADGAPEWATLDADTGRLVLRPGFGDVGEFALTAVVTDGTAEVEHSLTVTVTPVAECEVPLALLRTADTELPDGVEPASALGKWLAAIGGCWVDCADGWQALSLPGEAKIENLCAALGCERIWLYSTENYVAVSQGTLPAGTGFWAKVSWPKDSTGVSLWLTPVVARPAERPRFFGPLVGEEPPETLRGVSDGAWTQPSDWQIGLGLF